MQKLLLNPTVIKPFLDPMAFSFDAVRNNN